MITRQAALRTSPQNAFLLACGLVPWVLGGIWVAWDHRAELVDRGIRLISFARD